MYYIYSQLFILFKVYLCIHNYLHYLKFLLNIYVIIHISGFYYVFAITHIFKVYIIYVFIITHIFKLPIVYVFLMVLII